MTRTRHNSIPRAAGAANADMVSMLCSSRIIRLSSQHAEIQILYFYDFLFDHQIQYWYLLYFLLDQFHTCTEYAALASNSQTKLGVGSYTIHVFYSTKYQKYFRLTGLLGVYLMSGTASDALKTEDGVVCCCLEHADIYSAFTSVL